MDLNKYFSKKPTQMPHRSIKKKCSMSVIIREMQIKSTRIYTISHLSGKLLSKKKEEKTTSVGKDVEKLELLHTIGGNAKC